MNSDSTFNCFGVPIEGVGLSEALEFAFGGTSRWIVTANPEILLEAKKDTHYRETICQADLRVADGFGLVLMAQLAGKKIKRVTGVDLAEAIVARAAEQGLSVGLIGGGKGIAQRALEALQKKYPTLRGIAVQGGNISTDGTGDDADSEAVHQLTLQAPDILLVAFGHPKQEYWIAKHLHELPSLKIAIGVGGSFDYWAGTVPRAPQWMRSVGIEWLFRFGVEPKRIRRILNAVVVFPIIYFFSRF